MSRPSREAVVLWGLRVTLLVVLVASPWPFGSATPRPAAILSGSLLVLLALYLGTRLHAGSLHRTPGLAWAGGALALVALQLTPLPNGIVAFIAPAVRDVYAPVSEYLGEVRWHTLSIEPFQTQARLLQLFSGIAAFVLTAHLFRRGSEIRLFAYTVTALGVALSLFAVYQQARYGTVLYGRFPTPSGSPFGPFVNHNHFAGFVEVCALVTLGTALGTARRSPSLALLLGGATVLMGTALVLSHSRGGLLAFSAGLTLLAALSQTRERAGRYFVVAAALAVAVLLFALAPSGVFNRLATIGNPGADTSVQFRVRLWADSLGIVSGTPAVGSGLGTYAAMVPAYRTDDDETRARFAESDWMQLMCETGVLGLILACGFLAAAARNALRRIHAEESPRTRGVLLGAMAASGALVVHGVFDFNLQIPSNAILCAMVFGIVARSGASDWEWRPRLWHGLAAAPPFLLFLALAATSIRYGESRELERSVNPLLAAPEEFTDIIQELARSRESVPANAETAFLLGRLYSEEAFRSEDAARYRDVRFAQAAEAFRVSVALGPARGGYWFELAWTLANQGDDALADPLFERAVQLEPQWANLRANYALYLASRGRVDEALAQLERGRALTPGLTPMEALDVIAPYVAGDRSLMRRAVGTGKKADEAIAHYGGDELELDK